MWLNIHHFYRSSNNIFYSFLKFVFLFNIDYLSTLHINVDETRKKKADCRFEGLKASSTVTGAQSKKGRDLGMVNYTFSSHHTHLFILFISNITCEAPKLWLPVCERQFKCLQQSQYWLTIYVASVYLLSWELHVFISGEQNFDKNWK